MNPTQRKAIANLADIVRDWLDMKPPIDMDLAVTKLGGQIDTDDKLDYEAQIQMHGDQFVIKLKNAEMNPRRRFTIAHELGHLFLHLDYLKDEDSAEKTYRDSVRYRSGYSIEEYEANEFAACLLMPEDQFRHVVGRMLTNGSCDLDRLAQHFDVSRDAARTRGRWLGLFHWPAI